MEKVNLAKSEIKKIAQDLLFQLDKKVETIKSTQYLPCYQNCSSLYSHLTPHLSSQEILKISENQDKVKLFAPVSLVPKMKEYNKCTEECQQDLMDIRY